MNGWRVFQERKKGGTDIETATRIRRREEIIDAAIGEFCENGYDRAKMEEIAHRANIGKSTIYEYFPSKLDLLIATGEFFLNKVILDVNQLLTAKRPVRQAISDYLVYISSLLGEVGSNFLHMVGNNEVTKIIHSLCIKYIQEITKIMIEVLRAAQDSGEISPDINILAAAALIVTLPNPPFLKMTVQEELHVSIDNFLDLLFTGFAPR